MKNLHLSEEDKVLGGVCGGLAESFSINANIIRGIFIASLLFGLFGLSIYLILLFILPKNGEKEQIIDVEVKSEDTDEEKPRIIRTWKNRMIAGVCSGLARYLRWDVSIIRIIFVLSSFVSGIGIILYVIFWFFFPNED